MGEEAIVGRRMVADDRSNRLVGVGRDVEKEAMGWERNASDVRSREDEEGWEADRRAVRTASDVDSCAKVGEEGRGSWKLLVLRAC